LTLDRLGDNGFDAKPYSGDRAADGGWSPIPVALSRLVNESVAAPAWLGEAQCAAATRIATVTTIGRSTNTPPSTNFIVALTLRRISHCARGIKMVWR
jgi:hypothetical protein